MQALLSKFAPSATDMIRADHTRVVAKFHRYKAGDAPQAKEALAAMICTALDIHAQVEEEIFYPAARAAGMTLVNELAPEHDEIRTHIATLRSLEATSDQFDATFMELMRTVIHHVADEETALLPAAEQVLGERLGELGAQMTKRRLQLVAPHAGEMARDTVRAMPKGSLLLGAGALLAGAFVLRQGMRR